VVTTYIADLAGVLSVDRLTTYRPAGGDDLAMVVTYFWNVALRQALYGSLGDVEVAIRNGIHRSLSTHFGRDDWYAVAGVLQLREQRDVANATKAIIAAGKPVVPGRIIAALHFGFWTSLLDTAYGDSPKGPQLWTVTNRLLAQAVPHAPSYYQNHRGRVYVRVDTLRRLRNRVFHHEPVWNGIEIPSRRKGQPPRLISLADVYAQIIDTIGWVSPTLMATTAHLDPFPVVYAGGYADLEAKLRRHLGM
jgi:hypothetical protein